MTTKTVRKIIKIDEGKCNGCGFCVPSCAEGALQIFDGKAKLISEVYCDGLGACLGECPEDAITIEERTAEGFDEEVVKLRKDKDNRPAEELAFNCPSARVAQFEGQKATGTIPDTAEKQQSMLGQWPIQLTLVPATAPFLQDADLVLTADCVPFTYASFHQEFLKDHTILVACPKLDNFQAHLKKLTDILRQASIKSLTVLRMEVPCCSGLTYMAEQAIQLSGKDISYEEIIIGTRGELK
ncbi:ATP-binding protein [Chloroflexota bacterium]